MRGTPYFFKNYLTGTQPVTQKGRNYRLYRNCQNNVHLAIGVGESEKLTATGVLPVIPAKAGIQNLDPGSESGVTVSLLQIGQKF